MDVAAGPPPCNSMRDWETLRDDLARQGYVAPPDLAMALHIAVVLGRPILLEGAAGVGKTEVARALAQARGTELIRLQCYEGIDESRALYEWEYAKQLLYTQLLRERVGGMAVYHTHTYTAPALRRHRWAQQRARSLHHASAPLFSRMGRDAQMQRRCVCKDSSHC
jgi:hypothetical protein